MIHERIEVSFKPNKTGDRFLNHHVYDSCRNRQNVKMIQTPIDQKSDFASNIIQIISKIKGVIDNSKMRLSV